MVARFTAIFATATSNTNQYVGIGDDNDGYFIGYQGTSFGIMRRTNGAETFTAQASFNIDMFCHYEFEVVSISFVFQLYILQYSFHLTQYM